MLHMAYGLATSTGGQACSADVAGVPASALHAVIPG